MIIIISRGFVEGRCQQVVQITIENHPRQRECICEEVIGLFNTTPLGPLQVNLFGESYALFIHSRGPSEWHLCNDGLDLGAHIRMLDNFCDDDI